MIADQAKVSKEFGSYPTVDPVTTTFVNAKSMQFLNHSHVFRVYVDSSTSNDLKDTSLNQSYMTASWVKIVSGDDYEYHSGLTGHSTSTYSSALFNLRYDKMGRANHGIGYTHRVGLTSSSGAMASTNYFWSNLVGHSSEWRLWLTSFYKEPISNLWKFDIWVDNVLIDSVYDRYNTDTSGYYLRLPSTAILKAYIGIANGAKAINYAQQAMWYGTNGDKFSQADADKIYNNNSATNWSDLSLDGSKNIICHYNFGDHDDDSTTSLNDLSSKGNDSYSGSCQSIQDDSPFV